MNRLAVTASEAKRIRAELLEAWAASERMTLITAEQMPAELYAFRYTPEAMSFAEQWRHCCMFTSSQLAARLGATDLYHAQKPPKEMTKDQVLAELKRLYGHVRTVIQTLSDAQLVTPVEFMGAEMPGWRVLYAMENHIIHHRGQCMVYLRLKGVTPTGYYGW